MTGPSPSQVSDRAWAEDALARERGRVQMFNAGRPDGLDGWTIALEQYDLLVSRILQTVDAFAGDDGSVPLQVLVDETQRALGAHPAFPNGRLTNYVRFTKVDLEARGVLERVPRSSPQRVRRTGRAEPLSGVTGIDARSAERPVRQRGDREAEGDEGDRR